MLLNTMGRQDPEDCGVTSLAATKHYVQHVSCSSFANEHMTAPSDCVLGNMWTNAMRCA